MLKFCVFSLVVQWALFNRCGPMPLPALLSVLLAGLFQCRLHVLLGQLSNLYLLFCSFGIWGIFMPSMRIFEVKWGWKMILSHRAPSSFNMSPHRAICTHFRCNSVSITKKILVLDQVLVLDPLNLERLCFYQKQVESFFGTAQTAKVMLVFVWPYQEPHRGWIHSSGGSISEVLSPCFKFPQKKMV